MTTRRPLTILSVAYPLAPVGPDAVGGAEQVLSLLDAALTVRGYHSIVVACQGSRVAGTLLETPPLPSAFDTAARQWAHSAHRSAIETALDRWAVDLVHLHGIDFHEYLPPPGVPVLATLHLPLGWYPPEVFQLERPATWLSCVSSSQASSRPAGTTLHVIENGIPVDRYALPLSRRRFAFALGRICPEKGFHLALEAALLARVPLLLAGRVFAYEAHQRYFLEEIVPRLDRERRFLGPVGLERKRRLLAAARCLVVPSLAPETSSLVVMEALAAGTPVVALPNGALRDLIEPGRTGFLAHDPDELAEAILAAGTLDREVCRQAARERFSADGMVDGYLDFYHRLVDRESP